MDARPPDEASHLGDLARLSPVPPSGEPPPWQRALRTLGFLLLAGALIGGPWYLVTRDTGGSAVEVRASPAPPPPSPTPSPTPPVFYEITGVDSCLRMRARPSTRAPVIDCLRPGLRLRGDGRTAEREGHLWYHVYDHLKKRWAWAAGEYLRPASS